jgi:membrane peptidoglycan carboxypeptidase
MGRQLQRPWSGIAFSMAVFFQLAEEIGLEQDRMGGSTLATQIEKYRHSAEGITGSGQEKLRQMISASVRSYRQGPQTLVLGHAGA